MTAVLCIALLTFWSVLIVAFAPTIILRWREPVFRVPVLVFESDDWGAGPLEQAEALDSIAATLHKYRDCAGRPAVMTLGIVLEVPDGPVIAADAMRAYHARTLLDPMFAPVRDSILRGQQRGVFALQLHGACHYWPSTLVELAQSDPAVDAWLTQETLALTEDLPSALQSRWVNATSLPALPHTNNAVEQAIESEVRLFQAVFGEWPEVAVPMTFVWQASVERAWARHCIDTIITCGSRATRRGLGGEVTGIDRRMLNGERGDGGQCYLVRDVYFEPALGHDSSRLLGGLRERMHLGRPCLVETHRFNFLQKRDKSVRALDDALSAVQKAEPSLRFLAPLEISRAILERQPAFIELRWSRRLPIVVRRLREHDRFRRAARITGLSLLLWGKL